MSVVEKYCVIRHIFFIYIDIYIRSFAILYQHFEYFLYSFVF